MRNYDYFTNPTVTGAIAQDIADVEAHLAALAQERDDLIQQAECEIEKAKRDYTLNSIPLQRKLNALHAEASTLALRKWRAEHQSAGPAGKVST
jgi:hypothetical protein